jgi:hypothetical protein
MRPAYLAAIALAFVVAIHVNAAVAPPPPTTYREENRQILIAAEQGGYNPADVRLVTSGTLPDVTSELMPAWQSLELHLDMLDARGVRLLSLETQTSNPPQEWPLTGEIEFHEFGWKQGGAKCPVIEPKWGEPFASLFDDLLPGNNSTIGQFTTSVSEAWRSPGSGATQTSTLKFTQAGTGEKKTWRYGGAIQEGWTIWTGAVIHEDDSIQYYCEYPQATTGVVKHHAIVTPVADRTDD